MSYFAEPYTHGKEKIKFEFCLSNYATKSDLNVHQHSYIRVSEKV